MEPENYGPADRVIQGPGRERFKMNQHDAEVYLALHPDAQVIEGGPAPEPEEAEPEAEAKAKPAAENKARSAPPENK